MSSERPLYRGSTTRFARCDPNTAGGAASGGFVGRVEGLVPVVVVGGRAPKRVRCAEVLGGQGTRARRPWLFSRRRRLRGSTRFVLSEVRLDGVGDRLSYGPEDFFALGGGPVVRCDRCAQPFLCALPGLGWRPDSRPREWSSPTQVAPSRQGPRANLSASSSLGPRPSFDQPDGPVGQLNPACSRSQVPRSGTSRRPPRLRAQA